MEAALFTGIKDFIIEKLNEASSSIRVAMAWFTNDDLYQVLLQLLDKGIKVELIIIDDHINRNEFGLDFNIFISKGGHFYLSSKEKNMHNKFCVIDTKMAITGSYNWTYYAEKRNWENIIVCNDETIIKQYEAEFGAIKKSLAEVKYYCQIKLADTAPFVLLNDYEYLYDDLRYKGIVTGIEYSNYLSAIKDTFVFEKKKKPIMRINTISSAKNAVTLYSLGMRCTKDGDENFTYVLIPKGTEIPCENKRIFYTLEDNQTSLLCETVLGESLDAKQNRSIGKIQLNDIPPLPRREGKMEVLFKITSDKTLHVKATNTLTKSYVEASYFINNLV